MQNGSNLQRILRRKRTRYELLADILANSRGGAGKTALMYRANLSYEVLTKYLSFLLENRFLEVRNGHFYPSRRGLIYLDRFAIYQRSKHRAEVSEYKIQSILPGGREKSRSPRP